MSRSSALLAAILFAGCSSSGPDQQGTWPTFWKEFRAAVEQKNRPALRALMPAQFDHSFAGDPQTPDAAFAAWDDPKIAGWDALRLATDKGAIDYQPPPQWRLTGKVKIAPPEAARDGYTHWRAVFQMDSQHHWQFISFITGD